MGDSSDATSERVHIGQLLQASYERFLAELHRRLAARGFADITPAHGNHVLRHIAREGSRLTEVAARANLTKQSVGYLVDHLEAHGYVERVADPADRRAKIVRFTPRGWELTDAAEAIIDDIEREWRAQLGAERWDAVRALLCALAAPEP